MSSVFRLKSCSERPNRASWEADSGAMAVAIVKPSYYHTIASCFVRCCLLMLANGSSATGNRKRRQHRTSFCQAALEVIMDGRNTNILSPEKSKYHTTEILIHEPYFVAVWMLYGSHQGQYPSPPLSLLSDESKRGSLY
jgi:hypothetical protein